MLNVLHNPMICAHACGSFYVHGLTLSNSVPQTLHLCTRSLSQSKQNGSQNSGQHTQNTAIALTQAQQPFSLRTILGPAERHAGHLEWCGQADTLPRPGCSGA